MTDKEKQALLKEKEPEFIAAFYKSLYPGEKETIKARKAAEITKMFKKEHGEPYDGGNDGNGLLWNCYPDKICFSISGLGASLQITWGKLTTKLLQLLDAHPEIIDADSQEIKNEPKDEPKDDPAQEAAAARDEREELEDNTDITEPDPEHYEPFDVWNLLMDHQKDLQAYREAGMPDNLMQKQRILTDALELLYSNIKEAGEDE